ncbi:LapA family protein [Oceanobacillus alkalisoli]|uniref:LapA family protein n=1 Tax=Oceanobacillus alkalisoli TaxID=2925113 RepID=UPI001EE492DC|nr:lipopolysaccharide assembly protein LapA domain-containing protein [Oceanobacillus alkalisoli]MCG5104239.1 lipopolysaccharide assembly protein LapA domain-containing protein [Oceanobacillus alkalisoli]
MKGQGYVILAIVLTILIAIFAVINIEPVQVNYFFWSATSPLILVILFSVLMGGLITAVAGMFKIFQMRKQMAKLEKEHKLYRKSLENAGITPPVIKEEAKTKKLKTAHEKE